MPAASGGQRPNHQQQSATSPAAASQQETPIPIQQHQLVSPLRAETFQAELCLHPETDFAQAVVKDIVSGVSLGYKGPKHQVRARNLLSADEHPEVIDQTLAKEVQLNRIAGPYDLPPLPNLHCSGIGLVPKKSGGWRMITHLSAPAGQSVNDFISKEDYKLQYASVDDAIQMIQQCGPRAMMAKADIKSAFRLLPVRKEDWHLLGTAGGTSTM